MTPAEEKEYYASISKKKPREPEFDRVELRILIATQALAHCYFQGIGVEELTKRCFEVADAFIAYAQDES